MTRLRRRLLAWYDRHRRPLPWRTEPIDSYATLVSETMLQQTQIVTVVPYYRRFMERFPNVKTLAAADIGEVLSYWAGLGYYRRCHHLHAAARLIARDHGGTVPRDLDDLLSLPGIGRYTAGAIASIAFRKPVPAVDGNARRVLARLLGLHFTDRSPAVTETLWSLAAAWVRCRRPGDFNQALMELGSRVCAPRRPACTACPLRTGCAHAAGEVAAPPGRRRREKRTELVLVTVAIQCDGQLLYHQRPQGGLWAGLWEWPTEVLNPGDDPARPARRIVQTRAPGNRHRVRPWRTMTHVLTHRRVVFHAFHALIHRITVFRENERWLKIGAAAELPMSRAQSKLLAMMTNT